MSWKSAKTKLLFCMGNSEVRSGRPADLTEDLSYPDNGWLHSKAGGVRSPGFLELLPEMEVETLPPWLSVCVTVGGGEDEPLDPSLCLLLPDSSLRSQRGNLWPITCPSKVSPGLGLGAIVWRVGNTSKHSSFEKRLPPSSGHPSPAPPS